MRLELATSDVTGLRPSGYRRQGSSGVPERRCLWDPGAVSPGPSQIAVLV